MLLFYLQLIDAAESLHFEDLYNKYNDEVRRYAMLLVHNYHDAEDIAQDTWLVIAQRFDSLCTKDDVMIKAYLMKVTKYMSNKLLKKRTRQNLSMDLDQNAIEESQDLFDTTLFAICQNETYEHIRDCLNSIDEKYRDVLTMYYSNHSSAKEIAGFYNLSENNVRKILERGRVMLIKALQNRGELCNE